MQNKKIILTSILVLLLIAIFMVINCFRLKEVDIYFLGIADADAILIKEDKNIIIDAGRRENWEKINSKLKELNIETIDYLILTHPDNDHIGTASFIIENYEVKNVFQSDFDKGSKLQEELNDTIIKYKNKINNVIIRNIYELKIGNLKFKIYPAVNEYDDANNSSLVIFLDYKKINFFFGADMEAERTKEILDLKLSEYNLLKVPHHGRYNSYSKDLIEKIKPKYAVITSNVLDEKINLELEKINADVYLTDRRDIHFRSNGKYLKYID